MKALFMEFQQETHENIPAPRIPTGKPREHSCSWGSNRKTKRTFLLMEIQLGAGVYTPGSGARPVGGRGGQGGEGLSHLQEWVQCSGRPPRDRGGHLGTGLPGSRPSYSATSFHKEHMTPCLSKGLHSHAFCEHERNRSLKLDCLLRCLSQQLAVPKET